MSEIDLNTHILVGLTQLTEQTALMVEERAWLGADILSWLAKVEVELQPYSLAEMKLVWPDRSSIPRVLYPLLALKLGIELIDEQGSDGEVYTVSSVSQAGSSLQLRFYAHGNDQFNPAVIHQLQHVFAAAPLTPAVIFSEDNFACLSILASWWHAKAVRVSKDITTPAQVLRILEQSRTSTALLDWQLLLEASKHPAFMLTNLRLLSTLITTSTQQLNDDELAVVTNKFSSKILPWWVTHSRALPMVNANQVIEAESKAIINAVTQHPAVANAAAVIAQANSVWAIFAEANTRDKVNFTLPAPDLEVLENALNGAFSQVDFEFALAVVARLNQTALLSMLNGLQHLGLFSQKESLHNLAEIYRQGQVADRYQSLILRWLNVLEAEHLLLKKHSGWQLNIDPQAYSDQALTDIWQQLEIDWKEVSGTSLSIDYAKISAKQLPELIQGKVQAVHLLFPQGSTELACALYQEGIPAQYQQKAASQLLKHIIGSWLGEQPISIMELGAGTGSTTQALLPELDALHAEQATEFNYLFTDLSTAFHDSFNQRHPMPRSWFRQGLYDIDQSPREQGYKNNSLDIVIAGGVLNAATDTDKSLAWISQLLKPGGWFILTEPTSEEYWVMASQAFMLTQAEDDRANSESTFLSYQQWLTALQGAKFEMVVDLPKSSHPLARQGHRFMALRAKPNKQSLTATMLSEQIYHLTPNHTCEVVDCLPYKTADELDSYLLQQWANALT